MYAYRNWMSAKRVGHCLKHYSDLESLQSFLSLILKADRGKDQSAVKIEMDRQPGEKRPGRKPDDHKQQLTETIYGIKSMWDQVKLLNRSLEHRLKLITQMGLAAFLNLGDEGTKSAADQLSKRLIAVGVRDQFPGEKQWFRAFVRTVVEQLEMGLEPEKIRERFFRVQSEKIKGVVFRS